MPRPRLLIALSLAGLSIPGLVFAGTVLSAHKYAWSNKVGYINFGNVIVDSSALSGYAWSSNAGWIKFNPSQGGVKNDGNGKLSGSAWGESLGWIDFGNVTISPSTGKFSGTATGNVVGTITFDCPSYCDVQTDWRPSSEPARPRVSQSIGGSVARFIIATDTPMTVMPIQTGSLTVVTTAGPAHINVPSGAVPDWTTFTITEEPLGGINTHLVPVNTSLVNEAFYTVTATDRQGNLIHHFDKPITITLPIPASLEGDSLGLYWRNETNGEWVQIPDAVFTKHAVTFSVTHLTMFAIFKTIATAIEHGMPKPSLPIPEVESKTVPVPQAEMDGRFWLIVFSAILVVALYEQWRGAKKRTE